MTTPSRAAGTVSRGWRLVAWGFATIAWALAAGGIGIGLATGNVPAALADWVMDLVVAVIYPVTTVVLLPRTRHVAVWILAVLALGCALAAFAEQYDSLGGRPPTLPGQGLTVYATIWVWMPGTYASIAILPWLLTGRRRGWGVRLLVGLAATATALATVRNATIIVPGAPHNPLGVPAWQGFTGALGTWPEWVVLGIGTLALADLVVRRRTAARGVAAARAVREAHGPDTVGLDHVLLDEPADRVEDRTSGLSWLLAAQAVLVLSFLAFLWPVAPEHAEAAAELSGVALVIAQAFLPGAVLVLVLGQRLWGVDVAVSRAIMWITLSVAVVSLYLGALGLLGALLPGSSRATLAVVVALVTMAIGPLRRTVQRRVDRLVYGSLSGPGEVARSTELWARLEVDAADLDAVAAALREGLRLGAVEIRPTPPEGPSRGSAAAGPPAGEDRATSGVVLPRVVTQDVVVPLLSRGRSVGELLVRPRTGERLDTRTMTVVDQVAGLLGLTLDLVQSNAALEAARARLVEIRHDERRVLRRDLHDGLGPAIAGLRLGVGAALNLLGRDTSAAATMLEEVQRELSARGEDIRLLSRALLPPALDEGDLGQALTGLAQRFSGPSLLVTAHVDPRVTLGGTQQVAVYHIAAEALMNVHRHARASRCEVRVSRDTTGAVQLLVLDDGVGIQGTADGAPAAAGTGPGGVGLTSMRERVDELGGTLEIGPRTDGEDAHGTQVQVRLPAGQDAKVAG